MGKNKFSWSPSTESNNWKIFVEDESGEFLGVDTLKWDDTEVEKSLVKSVATSAWKKGLRATSGNYLSGTARAIIRTLQKRPMWLDPGTDIEILGVSLMCTLWNKNSNAAKGTCKIKFIGPNPPQEGTSTS